jgi:predicted transcriptional regulator
MSDVKQVGLTKRILEILKREPRQTPQSLLGKLDVSMSAIRNNLMVLSDLKLVEAETRGLYKITPLGEHVLENINPNKKVNLTKKD